MWRRRKVLFPSVFDGVNIYSYFKDESGGHRFQRIPPTERGGRVHTSSITVSVLKQNENKRDLQISNK